MRLKKKLGAAVSAVALVGAAAGIAVGVSVAAGAATGTSGGTWAAAQPFPGFSASDATLQAITCPSLGNCVAVGYTSAATTTPIVVTETNGVWGSAQVINGTGSLGNGSGGILTKVSCGGPGDCTATGTYPGTNGVATAFYVSETAGTWGTPAAVTSAGQPTGTYSEVNELSCGDVGYCTIVGRYTDQGVNNAGLTVSTPFTLDEAKGTWGTPQPVPGLASLPSAGNLNTLDSVSCTGASDCTASGESGGNGFIGRPFVVSETEGTWGNAEQLSATLSTDDTMISCPDATDCAVAATYMTANYATEIFTLDEANGVWGQPQQLSMPSSETDIVNNPVLSCRSAGNCVILGNMDLQVGTSAPTVPFAATETSSGTWGAAATLPGTPASDGGLLQGLSCVPGGDCTIAVSAGDASGTPYIYTAVSSTDGSIGSVQEVYQAPGFNTVYGLSCPQNGHCTLAVVLDNKYMLGTEASASTVALTASAPKVTYGAEQSETLTATASSAAGGTPTGTVTVTGPTGSTPCTITLANGTGTCTLTARQFPAGTDRLTATYGGNVTYLPANGTTTVTVGQAATVTRLSFTPSSITFSGAATKLTVTGTVSSTAGTPNGWTTVRVDGHAVSGCTNVWFSAGTVSCTGTTAILTGGKHNVTLSYSGRGNFAASASSAVTLTVGVARSTPSLSLSRSSVTYGSENAEKFTVSVSHVGSVHPTGKAQVRIGGSTLCTVTLSNGAGSCTLTAKQLRAGSYTIIAVYLGDVNYHSSGSGGKTLKVAA
jgi:hypothetical protein